MNSVEIKKIIRSEIRDVSKKLIAAVEKSVEEKHAMHRNYFKQTEKLLSAYPYLKQKIKQDEKDIQDLQTEVYTTKSKDVIYRRVTTMSKEEEEIQSERIRNRKASMERTKKEVERIESALDQVRDDSKYKIIRLKYFNNKTNEEIAEVLDCDERTVRRHKNRLINKLKVILFGVDAV